MKCLCFKSVFPYKKALKYKNIFIYNFIIFYEFFDSTSELIADVYFLGVNSSICFLVKTSEKTCKIEIVTYFETDNG